jgi:NADPH:quinone reductase-like Zn-dependent oxidoreductase
MVEGAGGVVEGVSEFAVGDRVVSTFFPCWPGGELTPEAMAGVPGDRDDDGYAREEAVVPATVLTRVPAGYTYAEAATLPCAALTAWRGLFVEAQVKPSDTVLIQGTGGVSIFALQFAKAAGARVIATSSSPGKLERLRESRVLYGCSERSSNEKGSDCVGSSDPPVLGHSESAEC